MPVEPILPNYITEFVSSSTLEQRKALMKLLEDQDSYLTANTDSNVSETEVEHKFPNNPEIPHEVKSDHPITTCQNVISSSAEKISDCVIHVNELDINKDLSDGLLNELTSLKLRTKRKKGRAAKVKTQWLSPEGSSRSGINSTKSFSDFPSISRLMHIVNSHPSTSGDMTDCLVSCMSSKHSSLTYHADDEPIINQNSDICTVSLGPPRKLDFIWKNENNLGRKNVPPLPEYSVPASDLSLNIMKAGSQTKILHRGPSGDVGGIRYSLSFRRIVSTPPILVQEADATPAHSERNQVPSNKRKIVLLVGDSYFDRLDTNKLAKGKQSVFKVAKGGREIDDVLKHTKTFLDANPDFEVRKLFVCVGTNDIRYCHDKGVNHLKTPLKNFFTSIKQLAPHAKIFIQSLLPIPSNDNRFSDRNVLAMNRLLYNMCSKHRLFFIDAFTCFLNGYGNRNLNLFPKWDESRKFYDIHPNSKGMGVLARQYIFLIHSNRFSIMAYN